MNTITHLNNSKSELDNFLNNTTIEQITGEDVPSRINRLRYMDVVNNISAYEFVLNQSTEMDNILDYIGNDVEFALEFTDDEQ